MGFLDTLKGMVVEAEPGDAVALPAQGAAPTKAVKPNGAMPTFAPISTLNQAMVDAIRKATFGRNTALTALITASDALADIIPDPTMRLKAAQKTAGAGRGAREIADAVAIHLNDVDGEEMRFGQALNVKIQTEVGGLNRSADACEAAITQANNEIQTITARLQTLQQSINDQTVKLNDFRAQAQTKEHELRQAETEFKAAAQAVRAELNGHKATILSTLG
jgi:hypothetical protein